MRAGRLLFRVAAATALAAVGACTVGPDFHPPAPAAQNGFAERKLGAPGPGDVQQTSSAAATLEDDWWSLLGQAKLAEVEREALARNWTLASRTAAIDRARQELAAVRGRNYPQLDAGAQLGQTRIGATVFGPDAYSFPIFSSYGGGLGASYEVDVFGGRRRQIEQAAATAQSQVHERDAAALALIADVALQAIEIASAKRDIELTQAIIAQDDKTLELVHQARLAGAAPDVDVDQASAQLAHDRATLPPLRQRQLAAQNALAALVGRSPTDWRAPDFDLADFILPATLPAVVPSTLARQRPDILAAEDRLHASSAAIGVATAQLYPQFDLSAVVTREGLFDGPSETAWTLLGGVSAPLFNGGRLVAGKHAAEAAYRASFADYQQVVVSSLAQVASQLDALANDADQLAAQEQARASASRSLALSQHGYAEGSIDLTRLLIAQHLEDEALLGVEAASSARLADTVRLFLALGFHPPADLQAAAPHLQQ